MSNRETPHASFCEDVSQYEHDTECQEMRDANPDAEACFCAPCPECNFGAGLDYSPEAIEEFFATFGGRN
jgi:hypothetical protein